MTWRKLDLYTAFPMVTLRIHASIVSFLFLTEKTSSTRTSGSIPNLQPRHHLQVCQTLINAMSRCLWFRRKLRSKLSFNWSQSNTTTPKHSLDDAADESITKKPKPRHTPQLQQTRICRTESLDEMPWLVRRIWLGWRLSYNFMYTSCNPCMYTNKMVSPLKCVSCSQRFLLNNTLFGQRRTTRPSPLISTENISKPQLR